MGKAPPYKKKPGVRKIPAHLVLQRVDAHSMIGNMVEASELLSPVHGSGGIASSDMLSYARAHRRAHLTSPRSIRISEDHPPSPASKATYLVNLLEDDVLSTLGTKLLAAASSATVPRPESTSDPSMIPSFASSASPRTPSPATQELLCTEEVPVQSVLDEDALLRKWSRIKGSENTDSRLAEVQELAVLQEFAVWIRKLTHAAVSAMAREQVALGEDHEE